jgi:hypothetical protein
MKKFERTRKLLYVVLPSSIHIKQQEGEQKHQYGLKALLTHTHTHTKYKAEKMVGKPKRVKTPPYSHRPTVIFVRASEKYFLEEEKGEAKREAS